jgi:hypothetical protein
MLHSAVYAENRKNVNTKIITTGKLLLKQFCTEIAFGSICQNGHNVEAGVCRALSYFNRGISSCNGRNTYWQTFNFG